MAEGFAQSSAEANMLPMPLPRLAALLLVLPLLAQRPLPSPKDFLGHDVGADHCLASYTQLQAYWKELAARSDRMRLQTIGQTSYGQEMLMAIVSSPGNLERLDELKSIARRLAKAEGVDRAQAQALAEQGRAVVWIDGGLHATESIAGQNILELVWRMVGRDDAEVRRILDEVVLLVCPVNPDGMELVAKTYGVTRRVGGLPVLYQRYVGHDNNRDHYLVSQKETEAVARIFYAEWFPQIVYNHHQSAPAGTVIFTPPFRDPFNYHVDPLVVRGIEWVATHMNQRFTSEGKAGVISRGGAGYSTWWNGGLRTTTYFHNMIGILTEVFGSPNPTALHQSLERRLPNGDYPLPIGGRMWHARDTVEYLQTANFAILELAANYRRRLLFDIWQMGDRQIRLGSGDHWTVTPRLVDAARQRRAEAAERREEAGGEVPREDESQPRVARRESEAVEAVFKDPALRDARGYVLPADQKDFEAAVRFVRALQKTGVDVHRATQGFEVAGKRYAPGALVVLTAQAFRPHVLDMFEPQWHPHDVRDGEPVRPYDAAGWTLALQMGVEFDRVLEPFGGPFEKLTGLCPLPPLAADEQARRAAVRLALYDAWGGNMETGWTHWVLQENGFRPELIGAETLTAGKLRERFDALILHAGLPAGGGTERAQRGAERAQAQPESRQDVDTLLAALPPFEDWNQVKARRGRLERDKVVAPVREFVAAGGRLIALGSQAAAVARLLELPLRAGTWTTGDDGQQRRTTNREFFIPGSLLRLELEGGRHLAAMFRGSSTAFDVLEPKPDVEVKVLGRWAQDGLLVSGWAHGEKFLAGRAAIVEARIGEGSVWLCGADAIYRGQPLATHRLLFDVLLRR
jgi:hypothetical protein